MELEYDLNDPDSMLVADVGTSTGLLGCSLWTCFDSAFVCWVPICESLLCWDGLLMLWLGDGRFRLAAAFDWEMGLVR